MDISMDIHIHGKPVYYRPVKIPLKMQWLQMHQYPFSAPDPAGGAYDASPESL